MSSWAPTKYKTKNCPSYNDSLNRRGSLSIWFDPEMVWIPPPTGKRGRPTRLLHTIANVRLRKAVTRHCQYWSPAASPQHLNLNQHRLALPGQSIRATASYMTSAAARMLALADTLITPAPKWQHFALPFGSLLLCR